MEQKVQVMKPGVTVGDLGSVFCVDSSVQNYIRTIQVYKFSKNCFEEKESPKTPHRVVVSVLQIIKLIQDKYPNCDVISVGEPDIVVELIKTKKYKGIFIWIKVILVCLVCFFGTAFTIMAFHNDIGITSVFARFYYNITGTESSGVTVLELSYTVGLVAGMCIFFNHVGGRRITKDPTPIEVEMKIYEDEVNRTLIATSEREGKEIDVS